MSQSHDLMPEPEQGLRTSESLRLVRRAVLNKWDIPDEWLPVIPRVAMQILSNSQRCGRERLRAMELIRQLRRDNLDAAAMLDKIERLDANMPTENQGVIQLTFDQGG